MRSSDGKPLQCFEVAEYDGIYYPATAEVVGAGKPDAVEDVTEMPETIDMAEDEKQADW